MPYTTLKVKPGFYTENTRAGSPGRWVDGDHIRFNSDLPEKIGGWQKLTTQKLTGVARDIKTWTVLSGDKFIGFGTHLGLQVYFDGSIYDITPARNSASLTDPFKTTNGSSTVTVSYPNHGLNSLDKIRITNSEIFGGLTLDGDYPIASIIDANNFTINANANATSSLTGGGDYVDIVLAYHLTNPFSTVMGSAYVLVTHTDHGCFTGDTVSFTYTSVGGVTISGSYQIVDTIDKDNYAIDVAQNATTTTKGGGVVNYVYKINSGTASKTESEGYGTKGWSIGTWSKPRFIGTSPAQLFNNWGMRGYGVNPWGGVGNYVPEGYDVRLWSLDIFQGNLVSNPRGGGIYIWKAGKDQTDVSAYQIPTAPEKSSIVATWPESDILISFGCTREDGVYDPMHIRWSDKGSYNSWAYNPDTDSSSSFVNLSDGNEILAICKMRGQILVATDTAIYSMYEDGSEFIFGFKSVGNARVISQNCMVEVNGVAFYMGEDQFYSYDGNLQVFNCDVNEKVFKNLNYDQAFKVYGSLNSAYNEIWWFYPSNKVNADGNINVENDSYVIYNYQKNIWYFGTMDRTAYTDIGVVTPRPIGVSPDGVVYSHEYGGDADGEPLSVYLQSGDLTVAERNKFAYIKSLIPDMLAQNTNITLTLSARKFPSSTKDVKRYEFSPNTDVIGVRQKGGQVNFSYYCNSLGSTFAAGDLSLLIIPTGAK